jgi:hypothetical protein
MAGSEWADLEWHEQIARRIEAERRRPLRIRDLIGAVVVSAVVLGLIRFAADVFDRPADPPIFVWLAGVAVAVVLAGLGVTLAIGLGRVATALYAWGRGRSGVLAWAALGTSVIADFAAIGLLMAIALGFTMFLVVSTMMLWMSWSES